MVEHQSKEVVDKISQDLKIQPALRIPREIEDKIKLVYNVNPENHVNIVKSVSRTTTGTVTIFATPTDRDFYITSVFLQNQSDSAADNIFGDVRVTINGVAVTLLIFQKITLTVFNYNTSISFFNPIKIDRGTNVTLNNTFGLGVSVSQGGITGYTTDPQ